MSKDKGPVAVNDDEDPVESGLSTEPKTAPGHLHRQSEAAWQFTARVGHLVRYDHEQERWLIWSKHYWKPDLDWGVKRLWLDVLGQRYLEALKLPDPKMRTDLVTTIHAAGSTNAAIMSGLAIAAGMEPITTKGNEWDTDPYLLGCENGTVDLRTGERHDGLQSEMISLSTGIEFHEDAICPRWDTFFLEVFGGNEELAEWMDLALGAALIGTSKELLVLNWGETANNGKTKFAEVIRIVCGNYADVVGISSFTNANRKAGAATPDLMVLRTARLVFTSEPDRAAKLNGGTLKRMVSEDTMPLRANYGDEERKAPGHTFFLQTNNLPTVDDAGEGFWRRIALVPWPVHFLKPGEQGDGPKQDKNLKAKLLAEAEGILAKMVRNSALYWRGLSEDEAIKAAGRDLWPLPEAIQVQTLAYRQQEDKLLPYINERLVFDPSYSVQVGTIRKNYREWCEANDIPPHDRYGPKVLKQELTTRGHGVGSGHDTNRNVELFTGVKLTANVPSSPPPSDPPTEPPQERSGHGGRGTRGIFTIRQKSEISPGNVEVLPTANNAPESPEESSSNGVAPGVESSPTSSSKPTEADWDDFLRPVSEEEGSPEGSTA